mgnify:CR=1 FL=1
MPETKLITDIQKRQEAARIWLSYYNRALYKKGIITEQERNRMELKICKWQMPIQIL